MANIDAEMKDILRKERDEAVQRIAALEVERDAAFKNVEFTQEWYAQRWVRLEDWARKEIPDELSNQFFSIIANGQITTPYEPPTYAQQFNILKFRMEAAERLHATLKDSYNALMGMYNEQLAENERLKAQVERLTAIPTSEEIPCGAKISPKRFQDIIIARAQASS